MSHHWRKKRRPPSRRPGCDPNLCNERVTPRQRFQMAMIVATLEQIHEQGTPCLLCGMHTHSGGAWYPTPRLSRYLGAAPDKYKVMIYALCDTCRSAPDFIRRVEDVILEYRRSRLAAEEAGLEIVDNFAPFEGPVDLAWFAAAYERNAPPA